MKRGRGEPKRLPCGSASSSTAVSRHPSGGFLYDRMLVESLRQAGDHVQVISLPWESRGRCLAHNFDRGIRAWLRTWQGDLLLQDELVHPSLFLQNRGLRRTLSAPIVSIVHHLASSEREGTVRRGATALAERAYLRSIDGFIFNGEITRAAVEELRGGPCAGIVAHPAGDRLTCRVTDDELESRGSGDGHPAGSLHRQPDSPERPAHAPGVPRAQRGGGVGAHRRRLADGRPGARAARGSGRA